MSSKKISIKDLSNALGVSVSTVSKALNGYPDVNPSTRKKVMNLAKELQYFPNQQAINFRKKTTKIIGLVLPQINHFYFSKIVESIVELSSEDNISVIVKPTFENLEKEKMALLELVKFNVDGILISLSDETRFPDHLVEISNLGIPIVEFDKISKLSPLDKVVTSDRDAAKKAVEHLISRGKKTIAHLRGSLLSQNSIDRFLGFKSAITDSGLTFEEELVIQVLPNNINESQRSFARLFNKRKDIDAVFAITDIAAIAAIRELKLQSIDVPGQVSVVGFSNWQISNLTTPRLTTIDQNAFEMARVSYQKLLENIKIKNSNSTREKETIFIKTDLIIRESS
jgi:LacI family transcriptional regulator